MKQPYNVFLIICFLIPVALCAQEKEDLLQKGIDLFYKRADGANGLSAKTEVIDEAIVILEKELLASNQPEKSGLYYLLSLNFKARFVCSNETDKRIVLNKAIKVAEVLKEKFPKSGPICFEYITAVGLLAEISGSFKSAKDGVVGKMKSHAEKLIVIDSMYNGGAGWKVLGILHYRTPNLGIVLNWPDKKTAKKILEKALSHYPLDIANNFYYAEALLENNEPELAKVYFNALLKMESRKGFLLEDLDFKTKAVLALQKL